MEEEEEKEKNLLDFDIEEFNKNLEVEKENKKIVNRFLILLIPNLIFITFIAEGVDSIPYRIFMALIIEGPILGLTSLTLGLLFAFIPYKGLGYKKNYYRSVFSTYYAIQIGIFLIALVSTLGQIM